MKEKIKNTILVFSISYIVILSVLTIVTLNNVTSEISVSMKDFTKEFASLNKKLNTVEDTKCRNSIKKLITKSEKNIYKEKIDLRDLYKNGSILPEYGAIRKNCNITEEESNKLTPYFLNSVLVNESFIQKAMFEYEIRLTDIEGRMFAEASVNQSKLNANKYLEIELIEKIIEVQNEK